MGGAYGRVYVWQLQNDYPGASPNDSELNIGEMWVKAADGMYHQGAFDSHSLEVKLPDQIAPIRKIYDDQKINMIPWVVPHGMYPGYGPNYDAFALPLSVSRAVEEGSVKRPDLAALNLSGKPYAYREGYFHGLYAVAAKDLTPNGYRDRAVLIIDLEPSYYGGPGNPQFWREDLGAGSKQVGEYLDGVAAAGVDEVWIASVHRSDPSALRSVSFSTWWGHPLVTKLAPQTYWTDFGSKTNRQKPLDAIREFELSMQILKEQWEPSQVIFTLPATGTPEELEWAYDYALSHRFPIPSIWRRGTMSSDNWQVVKNLRGVEWPDSDSLVEPPAGSASVPASAYNDMANAVQRSTSIIRNELNKIDSVIQQKRPK